MRNTTRTETFLAGVYLSLEDAQIAVQNIREPAAGIHAEPVPHGANRWIVRVVVNQTRGK